MELQLVPAAVAERVPAVLAQSVLRRAGVAHPPQEVADDVTRQQAIEVLRLQVASCELRHRRQRHLVQRPQQRVRRSPVARHLQAERLPRRQEGVHGPVAAVRVVPQCASEEQLHQRLQPVRALLAGAEVLARNARQIDDRGAARGQRGLVERAVHDAAQPDGRTGAARGSVVAQDEVFLDVLQERIDQRRPLPLRVRPQDRGRVGLAVERRIPGAEMLDQPVEDDFRCRTGSGPLGRAQIRPRFVVPPWSTASGPSPTASQAAISQPWNTTARPTCRTDG